MSVADELSELKNDLRERSRQFPNYPGTVERHDGTYRLRYYRPDELNEVDNRAAAEEWNEAVRWLDEISHRVKGFVEQLGGRLPEGETCGASVMGWVLADRFSEQRVSAHCVANAFNAIAIALNELAREQRRQTDTEAEIASALLRPSDTGKVDAIEEPEEASEAKPKECAHSPDFRSVRWDCVSYSFTANQAVVVRILWEAFGNGTPSVSVESLLLAIDNEAPPRDLSNVFRGSEAWGTIIADGPTKGTKMLKKRDE